MDDDLARQLTSCDVIAMIGTSDQSCWLAETCKTLLLLLLLAGSINAKSAQYFATNLGITKPLSGLRMGSESEILVHGSRA